MFDNHNSVLELKTATLELSLMGDSPLNQIISGAGKAVKIKFMNWIHISKNQVQINRASIYIYIIFQATGNPAPEIIWFKGESPIKESSRVAVVNSNTELRLSNIRNSDLDEYTCIARNGVDKISFSTRVVQAG